ncbi:MAG: HAMP domain-containing sensor histidine kinase [Pseudomonadota bacterium]
MTTEKAGETLEETIGEVDRVLDTFNAILRLSRLEAGEGGTVARTNITEIAEQLAELFEPVFEAKEIRFASAIGRDLIIMGDADLIAQALSNLLDNAIKYTPLEGQVRLEAARGRGGTVVLRVTDTGPGIPQASRGEVVKRFVRLESSRSEPGSGLGLSLVEAVADLHSGTFSLEDGDGPLERPGLSAVLRLPRA